jgi:hypothetical protein
MGWLQKVNGSVFSLSVESSAWIWDSPTLLQRGKGSSIKGNSDAIPWGIGYRNRETWRLPDSR